MNDTTAQQLWSWREYHGMSVLVTPESEQVLGPGVVQIADRLNRLEARARIANKLADLLEMARSHVRTAEKNGSYSAYELLNEIDAALMARS
jgi:hypothetical protein